MKTRLLVPSLLTLFLLSATLFSSCYTPSPLYGTWADNDGNSIAFMSDGTFVAKIVISTNTSASKTYQGDYSMVDNVISFSTDSGVTVNTEWDIRGSVLYLTWTADGITKNLTLYHISK